jgi:hypothetical protein
MLVALILAASTVASPIALDEAQRVFDEVRLASDEDGGKLWGKPLYGPILLVDRTTRFVVANVRDAEGKLTPARGVFTGTLPPSVIVANTATHWSGTRWTMVIWSAVGDFTVSRRRLLLHESWHRIQNELGFTSDEKPNAHLDTVDGRYWLQLELRALAAALRSADEARLDAIRDAITFRARRGAASPERSLENNEGLAEYTGWTLRGTSAGESQRTFAHQLSTLDPNRDFARSFAYLTGPAYGFLLDALDPGWTRRYKPSDDLADTLARAAKVVPHESVNVSAYQGEELRAFEEKRAVDRQRMLAEYRRRFIEGLTLELPMANARFGFDPDRAFTLGDAGTVHPSLDVTADWGVLKTTAPALIAADFTKFVVPAPSSTAGRTLTGDGWTLTLHPGWTVAYNDAHKLVVKETR